MLSDLGTIILVLSVIAVKVVYNYYQMSLYFSLYIDVTQYRQTSNDHPVIHHLDHHPVQAHGLHHVGGILHCQEVPRIVFILNNLDGILMEHVGCHLGNVRVYHMDAQTVSSSLGLGHKVSNYLDKVNLRSITWSVKV